MFLEKIPILECKTNKNVHTLVSIWHNELDTWNWGYVAYWANVQSVKLSSLSTQKKLSLKNLFQ